MKKIFSILILTPFLFAFSNTMAQSYVNGGNALAATGRIGTTTNQALAFITNNGERARITQGGFWGFGLVVPTEKVSINSTAGLNAFRVAVNGATKLFVHSLGGVSIGSGSNPPANGLFVTGSVGIGIATPAFSLDARAANVFGQFKSTGGYAGLIIDRSAANQNGYLIHRTAGVDKWTEGMIGNDNFSLRNWSLGSPALTVDITNNNVGIGATSTSSKLLVTGSTTAGTGITTTGYNYGLQATSTYDFGYGVFGSSPYLGVYGYAPSGTYGLFGYSNNIGAYGSGTTYGTYGYSSGGTAGAYGTSSSGYGVQGASSSNYGGYFTSTDNYALVATTTNAYYAGVFYGHVYASLGFVTSDKNLKKDIREFSDAMNILNKLKPEDYLFKDDAKYASLHLPKGRHYGLIAQDLEQVLPNLVSEAPHQLTNIAKPASAIKPTADGKPQPVVAEAKETKETITIKAVNYVELIPIIVKAMQEQDIKMKEQETEISGLKSELNELKALLKNGNSSSISVEGFLKQNAPNPLSNNTVIKYFTPNDTRNAQILITDMKGSLLKTYTAVKGDGQLTIRRGELPAGTYNYTLYVNSGKIDTKQMIIIK